MDKKKKIILSIFIIFLVLVVVAVISFSFFICSMATKLSSCEGILPERFSEGDYSYAIYAQVDKKEKRVEITGLSAAGEEKTHLIIPEYYQNYKISFTKRWAGIYGIYETPKVLYFNFDIPKDRGSSVLDAFMNEAKFIYSSITNRTFFSKDNRRSYVPIVSFIDMCEKEQDYLVQPANVNFYWNYGNAPNGGFYWIDYYENEEKISYIPEEPTREGYVFDGWYKEVECITRWNFDTDAVKKKDYWYLDKTDYKELYIDNALYAKWIKL